MLGIFGHIEIARARWVGDIADSPRAGAVVLPGEQHGAGRHADRVIGDSSVDMGALGSQAIPIWGADQGVAIAADFEGPQLIADDQNDIRLSSHARVRVSWPALGQAKPNPK